MKVPLEWLRKYVAVRLSAEALEDRLTMAGLEVTAIERIAMLTHGIRDIRLFFENDLRFLEQF